MTPPSRVQLDACFSSEKLWASHGLLSMPAARCSLRTSTRFWQNDPLGGLDMIGPDSVAGRVWNTSPQPEDETAGMIPVMCRPEGCVHFAGEHISLWIAWVNGALASAECVVDEIVNAGSPGDATST
jgi:monoamine oxidase